MRDRRDNNTNFLTSSFGDGETLHQSPKNILPDYAQGIGPLPPPIWSPALTPTSHKSRSVSRITALNNREVPNREVEREYIDGGLVTGREIVGYVGRGKRELEGRRCSNKGHWRKEKRREKTKQNPTARMHPRLDRK